MYLKFFFKIYWWGMLGVGNIVIIILIDGFIDMLKGSSFFGV